MDLVYFTENIIYDPKCRKFRYLESIVNHRNWLKKFDEYGYTEFIDTWKERLGKNFIKLGIIECGSSGDCLFHSIAEAFNFEHLKAGNIDTLYSVESLRELSANQVTEENFPVIIESYRLEAESFDFNVDWDPNETKTVNDLQIEILIGGNNFWGDMIILQLLGEALRCNFIIFRSDVPSIYPTMSNLNKYDKTIMLYYEDNIHFKLVGLFQGNNLQTIHKRLPKFVRDIVEIDTRQDIDLH